MRQAQFQFSISTKGRGIYKINNTIENWMQSQHIDSGLITVFIPHTSASLLIQENADPDVQSDLEYFLGKLVPETDLGYTHTIEGPDDMPSHIRSVLTNTSEQIPLSGGEILLGTWQGIFLWEHRKRGHSRNVVVNIYGN